MAWQQIVLGEGRGSSLVMAGRGEYHGGCREGGDGRVTRVRRCHDQLACLRTRSASDTRTVLSTTSLYKGVIWGPFVKRKDASAGLHADTPPDARDPHQEGLQVQGSISL